MSAEQSDLFSADDGGGQREQIARVLGTIGPTVMAFLRERGIRGTFHAKDLHDYVGDDVAPASADRILRELRINKHCNYEIINRRQSFYRILWIEGCA